MVPGPSAPTGLAATPISIGRFPRTPANGPPPAAPAFPPPTPPGSISACLVEAMGSRLTKNASDLVKLWLCDRRSNSECDQRSNDSIGEHGIQEERIRFAILMIDGSASFFYDSQKILCNGFTHNEQESSCKVVLGSRHRLLCFDSRTCRCAWHVTCL